eukprot:CAMPEP_0181297064 /NCGR_PEP_ID=MMETSP1101-20121128/5038_1 /TAXON_ID=46948 /ORGANISM="Rhodomonas abbreviata, Strain Caron Lab Isolate" /LENGTH=93 /DNA_ID=CAMNT_0023401971 /DNA_START=356 /DNA_END=637 /DNA_ORIENTATION=-
MTTLCHSLDGSGVTGPRRCATQKGWVRRVRWPPWQSYLDAASCPASPMQYRTVCIGQQLQQLTLNHSALEGVSGLIWRQSHRHTRAFVNVPAK